MVFQNVSVVLGSDVAIKHSIGNVWSTPAATVRVLGLLGASPHRNSHGCGKDSDGGLIRDKYMFHIVHSPSFALLAPMKPTLTKGLAIAADHEYWLWSSWRTVLVETEEMGCVLNSSVNCEAVVLCFWIQSGQCLNIPFRELILVSTVTPVGCSSSRGSVQTLLWIPWLTIHHKDLLSWAQMSQWDTHQQFVLFWAPDMSPNMWIAIFYL